MITGDEPSNAQSTSLLVAGRNEKSWSGDAYIGRLVGVRSWIASRASKLGWQIQLIVQRLVEEISREGAWRVMGRASFPSGRDYLAVLFLKSNRKLMRILSFSNTNPALVMYSLYLSI